MSPPEQRQRLTSIKDSGSLNSGFLSSNTTRSAHRDLALLTLPRGNGELGFRELVSIPMLLLPLLL